MDLKKLVILLVFLVVLPIPIHALTMIDAKNTNCNLQNYCETIVDLKDYLPSPTISNLKSLNLTDALPSTSAKSITSGITDIKYKIDGSIITIYGWIKGYSSNYWTMDLSGYATIDPWWNSTSMDWNAWYNVDETHITAQTKTDEGLLITPNASMRVISVQKSAYNQYSTNCEIKLFATPHTVIDTGTWSGDVCTYTNQPILNASTNYSLVWDLSSQNFAYFSTSAILSYATTFTVLCGVENWNCYPSFGPMINKITYQNSSLVTATNISLWINSTQANFTAAYSNPDAVNLTAQINVTDLNVLLYKNETLINNGTTTVTNMTYLPAGYYNFTAVYNGNSSFTASSKTWWLTINKASQSLTLTNNVSWSCTYPCMTNTSGNGNSTPALLYRNGSLISNPAIESLGVGAYAYIWNTTGNNNYSSNTTTNTLTISSMSNPLNLTFNTSQSVISGVPVLINCSGIGSLNLYNDTGSLSLPFTLLTTGLSGLYNYTCNTTGNANYTSNTTNRTLTINAVSTTGNSTIVYDIASMIPNIQSCFDSGNLEQVYTEANITRFIACPNGCDNVTNQCNMPIFEQGLIVLGIIAFIFIAVITIAVRLL